MILKNEGKQREREKKGNKLMGGGPSYLESSKIFFLEGFEAKLTPVM